MLAALLERQRQVVHAARGVLGVGRLALRGLAARPLVGRAGIARVGDLVLADSDADRLLGRDARRLPSGRRWRLARLGQAGLLARGLGERGEDLGRVVQLDELRGALDDLRLATSTRR